MDKLEYYPPESAVVIESNPIMFALFDEYHGKGENLSEFLLRFIEWSIKHNWLKKKPWWKFW